MNLRLSVSNISKSYDKKHVLKDCSFSFEAGGIYLLMGPNGSGKSTFLRICAILEEPDSGEINLYSDNNTMKKDINLRRRISLVLPKIGVFNTTVFKNVAYGLKIRGMKKNVIEEKVHRALEFVNLIHMRDMNALSLSSGETQMLGIARAIVIKPEILFLDEPTASLDPHSTTVIEDIISRIKEQDGMTIIMVTHNIFQAQRLADHVLFMYEGKIVDYGAKREFFEKPKDEMAYKFITGQMIY